MVSIRLFRGGAKRRPFYQIVVTDSRRRRDGAYIERLGFFNPVARGNEVVLRLDTQKVREWMAKGAQPTERVLQLLKQAEREPALVGETEVKADVAAVSTVETSIAETAGVAPAVAS